MNVKKKKQLSGVGLFTCIGRSLGKVVFLLVLNTDRAFTI
jgi:hypothetical protein